MIEVLCIFLISLSCELWLRNVKNYYLFCTNHTIFTEAFCLTVRVQDVAELLGMMVEDHKRVQPNVRTYAYGTFFLFYLQ